MEKVVSLGGEVLQGEHIISSSSPNICPSMFFYCIYSGASQGPDRNPIEHLQIALEKNEGIERNNKEPFSRLKRMYKGASKS